MLKQDYLHADAFCERTRHVGSSTAQLAGCRVLAELSREQPDTHLAGSDEICNAWVGALLRGCGAHAHQKNCEQNKITITPHKHSPSGLKPWDASQHIFFAFHPKSCPAALTPKRSAELLPRADFFPRNSVVFSGAAG